MSIQIDPLTAISSSINATIKILEVTYQLKAVDEQTADLLTTTRHVDFMVQEARFLRRLKAGLLNTRERTMIDRIISDTEDALRAVAKLVDRVRVDKDTTNSIKFGHRVTWAFRDNPSVRDKHMRLQVCCHSLTSAFTCLYSKDVMVIAPAPEGKSEEQPPPYDPQKQLLRDWPARRRGRKSPGGRERSMNEGRGSTMGGPSDIPTAGPSSPGSLAIPIENDGETSSVATHTKMFLGSPAIPTPEVQASVPRDKDKPLGSAIASPESNSQSPHISAEDSLARDDLRNSPSATQLNGRNDYIGPMDDLPNIDSPPFATMLAAYSFNEHAPDNPTPTSFSAHDPRASSLAIAPNTTVSDTSSSPAHPFPITTTPTSSKLSTEYDFSFGTFESSQYDSYSPQAPTEVPSLSQRPLRDRMNSDVQPGTTFESECLDAMSRVQDVMTREGRAMSVGQGIVKKGGRSWLAYHATRRDTAHSMDWDD